MSPRSILFLSTQLPYPPKSGGTIKSWNYLNDLSNRYTLGIACLLKDNDPDFVREFKTKLELRNFEHDYLSVKRSPLNLIKSYLGFPCLNVYRNYCSALKSKIEKIASSYDAIIVDHYEMFQYVPKDFSGKVILHTHNAEFELWQRMIEVSKNPILKMVLKMEANRVLEYEKKIIDRSDLVYATPSDIDCYQKKGVKTTNIKVTYHLGNDQLLDLPTLEFENTEESLLFMGTLSWEPNIDGIIWFIEEVYPKVLSKHPNVRLYILGKQTDDRLSKVSSAVTGIELCGFVDDIDNYLSRSRVFLAPLRFGSGMKVKVLEGMYRGLPMVTTEVGAEGIDATHGKELMIAQNAADYAQHCIELLSNQKKWEALRDQSRKKAAEKYRWAPLFESMDKELKAIL